MYVNPSDKKEQKESLVSKIGRSLHKEIATEL
jgi:hypothetical protein